MPTERVTVEIDCPWTEKPADALFSHLSPGNDGVCYLCGKDHRLGVTTMRAVIAAGSTDEATQRLGFRALLTRVAKFQEDRAFDVATAVFAKEPKDAD